MKSFVYKFVCFIGILLGFFLLTSYLVKYHSSFKVEKRKTILLVGHSHSETAYNDSLISKLANYSYSGESYFYTYFKVKMLLEKNPHIDTVFIEFTNNQINKDMDDWIWGDMYMSKNFPRYALFMDFESHRLLLRNNSENYLRSLFPIIKNNVSVLGKGLKYLNELGRYYYLHMNKTDSIIANMQNGLNNSEIHNKIDISEANLEYLEKIIHYCRDRKKKVFLIRSPLHSRYQGYGNERRFELVLKERFSDIEFLDFSKFSLPNAYFGDLEHLNNKGAKVYSDWINNLLEEGILDENSKQSIVNKEIERWSQSVVID